MVKQEPVSIKWQIVFMFIPFVSIWAYYRIEKLMSGKEKAVRKGRKN